MEADQAAAPWFRRVPPFRDPLFWIVELLFLGALLAFHGLAPVWSFATEGEEISGIIVAAEPHGEGGHRVTIVDEDTKQRWDVSLSNAMDPGDHATAYYLPGDPSKTASPGEIQAGLALLAALAVLPIVWPIWSWCVNDRPVKPTDDVPWSR